MGWETRERGGSYYYTKERQGSRVRSVYVGSGETARLISRLEAIRHDRDETEREVAKLVRAEDEQQDAEIDMLSEIVQTLTTATLLSAGFHTHKRQWRLRRDGHSNQNRGHGKIPVRQGTYRKDQQGKAEAGRHGRAAALSG
jgi:hypothetical protein